MYHHALLAQLAEHLTFNQGIMGSSPIRRTVGVAQLVEHRVAIPAAGGPGLLPLPQPQSSQSFPGTAALPVPADSFRSFLPSANAPLGHRFLHFPHGTLAQPDEPLMTAGGGNVL